MLPQLRCSITAFLFFISTIAFAQLPDSIEVRLKKAVSDTSRISILKEAAMEFTDSSRLICINEAVKICDAAKSKQPAIFSGIYIDLLILKGDYYKNMEGDAALAEKIYRDALALAEAKGDKQRQANALVGINTFLAYRDAAEARVSVEHTIQLQKECKDSAGLMKSFFDMGNIYSMTGKVDSTLVAFKEAYRLALLLKNKEEEAYSLDALGIAHYGIGNMQQALQYYYKSLQVYKEMGQEDDAYDVELHIGGVYARLGDYKRAVDFSSKSYYAAARKNEMYYMCDAGHHLGLMFRYVHQHDSSIIHLQRSLDLARTNGMQKTAVFSLINIGLNYLDLKDTIKAMNYLRQSLVENAGRYTTGLFETYYQIGYIYYYKGQTDSAFYYAKLSEKAVGDSKSMENRKAVSDLLRRVYEKKGDFKNAYKYYVDYITYRDTIDNKANYQLALQKEYEDENERKDLIAKSEREKKELEIREQKNKRLITTISFSAVLLMGGTLVYINRKRKEVNFRKNLADSEMKALRAQMNPHFMFNSLNAIQQMVLNNDNDNAFNYLDTYSRLTRKILENSEKKYIPVQDEIQFLELYLSIEALRFEHSFTYNIIVDDAVSVHSDKVPAMVVQPYVENAVKHGLLPKPGERNLVIEFKRPSDQENFLEVVVKDNGVGRKHSAESKSNSTHQSMGMSITENRLRLLEGKNENRVVIEDLSDENGNAAGTKVSIIIYQQD